MIRDALEDYRCDIVSLVAQQDRAAARMRFHGRHIAPFLGVAASGRRLEWSGAAFFELRDQKLAEIWVLGDTEALRAQLEDRV